jgi:hypothetical protein
MVPVASVKPLRNGDLSTCIVMLSFRWYDPSAQNAGVVVPLKLSPLARATKSKPKSDDQSEPTAGVKDTPGSPVA